MRARGFTLIELMIAIAIVAMFAGIVLPIGISRLNASSFVQTQRQLESAVGIARADAQRRARIVKLVMVESEGAVAVWSEAFDAADSKEQTGSREFVLELPGGTGMAAVPRGEDEEEDEERDEEETDPAAESVRTERVLCVLMPDGTVVSKEAVVLVGRGGERARIDINPWTGVMTFARIASEDAENDSSLPDVPPPEGPEA